MEMKNPFQDIDPKILESAAKAFQMQAEALVKTIEPLKELFIQQFKELQNVPESSKVLAEYGWYLSLYMEPGEVNELATKAREGNFDVVNDYMVNEIDDSINKIESELVEKFPHRAKVMSAAIRAHKNADFYLSIPVLMTQIEGVCSEITGHRFFKIAKSAPKISEWVQQIESNSIIHMFLEPLKIIGPSQKYQEAESPKGINRHDVLHGDSVDFGEDKYNSYKALSLLFYLSDTVYKAKSHLDTTIQ